MPSNNCTDLSIQRKRRKTQRSFIEYKIIIVFIFQPIAKKMPNRIHVLNVRVYSIHSSFLHDQVKAKLYQTVSLYTKRSNKA